MLNLQVLECRMDSCTTEGCDLSGCFVCATHDDDDDEPNLSARVCRRPTSVSTLWTLTKVNDTRQYTEYNPTEYCTDE